MEADFSGYATKAGLKCSDGRTITPEAFKHQDKMTVPLVWQHGHDDPDNVLGHVLLEAREDGIYGYGFFNDTPKGQNSKILVEHKDIRQLSIYANQLVEKAVGGAKQVLHGAIREVSLVLAGANPGAMIDYVRVAHADGTVDIVEDEAIIYTGEELEHEAVPSSDTEGGDGTDAADGAEATHAAGIDPTAQEVYDSLTPQQKDVVNYMIGVALETASSDAAAHSEDLLHGAESTVLDVYNAMSDDQKTAVHFMVGAAIDDDTIDDILAEGADGAAEHSALNNQEGTQMTNVFEQGAELEHGEPKRKKLTPEQVKTIMTDAERMGSLKESVLSHADEYGITDIDLMFPEPKYDGNGVSLISRRMEWVQNVLANTKHSPFSRIKSLTADITAEQARARGYVKGNLKKDEIIKMLKRVTTPKTIYKKQKLDRDDILDITDLDIIAWLKMEMRLMLDEELARAILIGDGRDADDEDKIDEDHIRPIAFDIDMYTTRVPLGAGVVGDALVDAVVNAMTKYKGSGNPTLYTTLATYTSLILAKDTLGRRLYATKEELAAALTVKDIVTVEVMEDEADLVAVIVNLIDYTVGADSGGEVNMFDFFDIDYNQQKYLIETRVSGALTRPKSAIAIFKDAAHVVTPTVPTFVSATGVLTVPTQTGTVYMDADSGVTFASGAQTAIAPGATVNVEAVPANGYGFTHDADREWSFTRDA